MELISKDSRELRLFLKKGSWLIRTFEYVFSDLSDVTWGSVNVEVSRVCCHWLRMACNFSMDIVFANKPFGSWRVLVWHT